MPKRKPARRESDKWSMRPRKLVLANELDYIRKKAAARIGCVVGVGPLILFSTESGDAWMLDPADHLAARIARDGEHKSVSIAETDRELRRQLERQLRNRGQFVHLFRSRF